MSLLLPVRDGNASVSRLKALPSPIWETLLQRAVLPTVALSLGRSRDPDFFRVGAASGAFLRCCPLLRGALSRSPRV